MFGEFTEATQLKTSLAKYSIEFNDLAVQLRPHRIAYLHITVCEKVCGQTRVIYRIVGMYCDSSTLKVISNIIWFLG